MILSMKYWQKVICDHTGDTLGLVCLECFDKTKEFYKKGEHIDMENIRENFLMQCDCCQKLVGADYTICDACGEIYPKGFDYRADERGECLPCHHGI